jgi:hypothetical protein
MTPIEIIQADAIKRNLDGNNVLDIMRSLIDKKQADLLQKNDTLLFLRGLPNNDAEMHLFTEDKPIKLASALKYFLQQVKASSLRTLYGKADNEQIIELMRLIGMDLEPPNNPEYNWMWKVKK